MFSLLIPHIFSEFHIIDSFGDYRFPFSKGNIQLLVNFSQSSDECYVIISSPIDDLMINGISVKSHVLKTTNKYLVCASKTLDTLSLHVIDDPASVDIRKLSLSPPVKSIS